ncbi:hypothetical protein GWK47_002462 [Chionoecetes opilio]|uniref:Uncharacterized protein n=1 Tax=Chionoecetes opilio TaxID=41210 RepID=A0A8J5BUM1_CHIOP|nr:hypothetical protein GWK47_002462 [Chionoecetes opilio]
MKAVCGQRRVRHRGADPRPSPTTGTVSTSLSDGGLGRTSWARLRPWGLGAGSRTGGGTDGISKPRGVPRSEGKTWAPDRDSPVNEHFVAFIHTDWKLYELVSNVQYLSSSSSSFLFKRQIFP